MSTSQSLLPETKKQIKLFLIYSLTVRRVERSVLVLAELFNKRTNEK